jgi:hypothetical protein
MKKLKVGSFKGNGFGLFIVTYVDNSVETIRRDELLFALSKNYMSEDEATAFKYADCLPNTIQVVS